MKDKLLDKIKSRGYWRVNFQPLTFAIRLPEMKQCKEIVEKNSVSLRGWDYPHIPRRNDENSGTAPCGDYYEAWEDWANHKEYWRMYKSGQFLYYRALREDWLGDDSWRVGLAEKIKPGTSLGIIGSVVYELTEVFEFLSRLALSGLYEEGVKISISLHNTANRELWVEDDMRADFMFPRKTGAPKLEFTETYTKDELLTNPKGLANKLMLQIFDAFGWNPSPEQIQRDQDALLSGRI